MELASRRKYVFGVIKTGVELPSNRVRAIHGLGIGVGGLLSGSCAGMGER
jgi:hypothetical protein